MHGSVLAFPLMPQVLCDTLRAAIIFGELEPDTRITEEEIAERFRVSRSPVREALRQLEVDGLVVRQERRGVRIAPLSRRDLDEVYRCRMALEGVAAAEAARNWRPEHLQGMTAALGLLERAHARQDVRDYFVASLEFLESVHAAAGNATLSRLLNRIGKPAQRYRFFAYRSFPELMRHSVQDSADLAAAIRRRDDAAARSVTERMIERIWRSIRECVPY